MAKLSAHGTELYRYFSTAARGLKSIRSDGVTLIKYPGGTWRVYRRKKPDVSLDAWIAKKKGAIDALPSWARECQSIPSMHQIEDWITGLEYCETVDGERCDPDHRGPGAPSWLVALAMM